MPPSPAYIRGVAPDSEIEQSIVVWVKAAQNHLAPLTGAVAGMEKALAAGAVGDDAPVAEVVVAIAGLLNWLGACEVPEPLRIAEGELRAATGVYRNAASLFRSLPASDAAHQEAARLAAWSNALSQGDEHVERFYAEVRSHPSQA